MPELKLIGLKKHHSMSSTGKRTPLHPLFRLLALIAVVFIVTVLSMIATLFGDPRAPVNEFFTQHGGTLIGVEVIIMLVVCCLAIVADRRRTAEQIAAMEQRALQGLPRRNALDHTDTEPTAAAVENGDDLGNQEGN